jgi:hypothetical protein
MQPEGSLPHSKEPATCPHHEADRSSPRLPPHFSKIHFNIIFPSTPGSSKCTSSLRFPHQIPVCTSTLPSTWYPPSCSSQCSSFEHINTDFPSLQNIVSYFLSCDPRPNNTVVLPSNCESGSSVSTVTTKTGGWPDMTIHSRSWREVFS